MRDKNLVFLSYARENLDVAERLYMSLREQHINVWLDSKCLKPGANWKYEINKAIRNSKYYILLLSKYSITKRGFVQKEIREALNILAEFPKDQIFIIPVRIDETVPIDDELLNMNWVDLYVDYHSALEKILRSLIDLIPDPLVLSSNEEMKIVNENKKIVDKGKVIDYAAPIMVGERRGAISYSPFRSLNEFLMQFVDRLPPNSIFADTAISYYFTLVTNHPELYLGDDLHNQYPERITLVLQHSYSEIKAFSSFFSVVLSFNGVGRTLKIPYDSIMRVHVPEIGLLISRVAEEKVNGHST